MSSEKASMAKRTKLRKLLLSRHGSITRIANRMGINKGLVSMALKSDQQRCGVANDGRIIAACIEEAALIEARASGASSQHEDALS